MAEIINLRRVRKAISRETDAAKATENRARHGRTKADKAARDAEVSRITRLLDSAKRED